MSNENKYGIKIYSPKANPTGFIISKFYQTFREEITILSKLFQKIEETNCLTHFISPAELIQKLIKILSKKLHKNTLMKRKPNIF